MLTLANQKLPAQVSCLLAFSIPWLLGAYWPVTGLGIEWMASAMRAGVFACAGLLALLWWKAPVTREERQWGAITGSYLALLVVPILFAANMSRAGKNWLRVFLLLLFGLILARAFRHPATRRAFGLGSLFVSLFLSLYLIGCYLSFMGPVLPTYESTRIFKETVLMSLKVGLNPLAFSCAFSGILAACVLCPSRLLCVLLALIVAISTVFTGSRTPLALMAASVLFVATGEVLHRRAVLRGISVALFISALLTLGWSAANKKIDLNTLSAITEGRVDLWSVAWQKFLERPWTGYGADSWADDMTSRLPSQHQIWVELVQDHVGGYHNTYLTLLAEEGAPVFAFAIFLLWRGFRTIDQSLPAGTGQNWRRRIYSFAYVFLLCRGLVEVPGIFGYGQDPAEFAAYTLLALIISLPAVSHSPGRAQTIRMVAGPHRAPASASLRPAWASAVRH